MTEHFDTTVAKRKVAYLNEQLDRRYGLSLSTRSVEHVKAVCDHYDAKRQFLLTKYGVSEAVRREDYAKAVMISEAARVYLREIAPTRTKKRTGRKGR